MVRRELSDNFTFYEPNYDKLEACAGWAQESLQKHASDKREYIYTWCALSYRALKTSHACVFFL